VADLVAQKLPLTILPGVGPHIQGRLLNWLSQPPVMADPPPIRRGFLTVSQAQAVLRANPQFAPQYHGDLQMHSDWSDGAGSIRDMATAGEKLGYEFIAITDHSKGLKIAGGIDEQALKAQRQEIDEVNHQLKHHGSGLQVLHGLELNLNREGQGDIDPVALAGLDVVVGSFHSSLRETTDQTDRYLAALRNPTIQILGHPRGRIYNHRLGLQADWARVFAEAARLNKAVEVDAYPDRQDLDVALLKIAKKEAVRIAIDTDAHTPDQLEYVQLGLAAACLAKIPPAMIVNFLSVDELKRWISDVREQ
jgi:histidinol phosphatase-like PHP family hydrolase